jgi:hypothetical protein
VGSECGIGYPPRHQPASLTSFNSPTAALNFHRHSNPSKILNMSQSAQSSTQKSIYSTLPDAATWRDSEAVFPPRIPKTTRLLRILPSPTSEPIKCELDVVELQNAPPFEALSYVWGNPDPPVQVECNGQPKSVTPNLGAALRRLRLEDKERIMWIDAICINQDDLEERSEQVKLMKRIYSQALRVIVWLGDDGGSNAEAAVKSIREIAESDSLENVDLNAISTWESVDWFFTRPWFGRIWVVQEAAFAPVLMYVGAFEIEWRLVGAAAPRLFSEASIRNAKCTDGIAKALHIWSGSEEKHKGSLDKFLNHFSWFAATDPRDKVFALLGLVSDGERGLNGAVPPLGWDVRITWAP